MGRCGPWDPHHGGGRCNKNLVDYAVYCNVENGWCGTSEGHKNAQEGDEYDWKPKSCKGTTGVKKYCCIHLSIKRELKWYLYDIFSLIVNDYELIPKACVTGHNIVLYPNLSVEECKMKCNEDTKCLAFEYGVSYGGKGNYKAKDCNLQNGKNKAGCNGAYHNLDLYVKKI